ncbi:ATP-binding protein [Alteromonas ponticola]|uniref:ATP-binding protein n=1 Tax=Alteromonas ponticola TaxID=2720613 RepID=A0ABX1R327_9ALTE|nr:ATP-binding protein [Alteromonas ponticola]NMH60842.1 ATP-binding protein [Alteromonas ponticola]
MANFKTRARALDLLGRQQIAGIPTAINELLKNAHDAYADRVDIDYFRMRDLFILRDDGMGMTKREFQERWLTLGTESKVKHRKSLKPRVDETKSPRISMGEKGIGRLAIASIGKQVLIVTKAKNIEGITVALINWQLFEIPGLNLEDIAIPVQEFKRFPEKSDIDSMKEQIIQSLTKLKDSDELSQGEYAEIKSTIEKFDICPKKFNNKLIGKFPWEKPEEGGTFFYISSVDDILHSDIDGNSKAGEATKIEKMLMGFHDTMTPKHPAPLLEIVFRDYRSDDHEYKDLIDKQEFFSVDDFELADHHFEGNFDEFGQFKGMVKIYREKTFDHIVNWRGNNFNPTRCGPFSINFAYLQGVQKESIVDAVNHAQIYAKSKKFGGLYVYKDNIRILPYGDSDYDYLEIEKRRNQWFGYFFSYRRMFGVIRLSEEFNSELKEKAGREGFIENKAYRQLREILKNFFTQLAGDFFSTDESSPSPKAEIWRAKRNEIKQSYKALEEREKKAKERKKKFEDALNSFFISQKEDSLPETIDKLLKDINLDVKSIYSEKDHDIASQKLLDIESRSRQKIDNFRKSLMIPAPRGFYIKGELKRDYETYMEEMERLDSIVFSDAYKKIDEIVEFTISDLAISISKRRRLEQAVESISDQAKQINVEKRKSVTESVTDINKRVKSLTSELMIDLDDQIRLVKDKFKTVSISSEKDIDLVATRNSLSAEINSVSERNTAILDALIRQLEGIYWEKDANNNYITNEQITNALGDELEELKERVHTDVELSQLGLAVSVIHHEFNSTVRSVRASLRDLKAWSDVNEQLEGVYNNIKINFEHLDGYLNLFTPLNRRLNRKAEDIKLLEVKTFLIDLFKSRMERHNITFKHTRGFARAKLRGYRSSFYPVFVNVIDNAIYWLNDSGEKEKVIRLHADKDNNIYISNNGVGIAIQDRKKIFELGFTRKENGRGMGLHISNEVLESVGYKLELDEPREGSNVTFKIAVANENNG